MQTKTATLLRTNISRFFISLFCFLILTITACDDLDSPDNGTDNGTTNWPEEAQTYDVTVKDDVVSIEEDLLETYLVQDGSSGDNGTYRFANPPAELAALTAGQKTILAGLDIVTIDSVSWDGDDLVLETSPAELTDVIKDGEIYWSRAVEMVESEEAGLQSGPLYARIIKPQTTVKFNGVIGQFEVQYSLLAKNNATDIEMVAKIIAAPGAKFTVASKGTVGQFHSEGTITIEEGKITYLEYIVRDLDLKMDIQFGGVETGKDEDMFKLPLTLRIPTPIGPLPTWIGIGGTVEFKSTLVDNTSTTGTARVEAHGTFGIRSVNGDITLLTGSNNRADVSFGGETKAVSTITSGLGIVLEFPKISFGVGLSSLSGAVYTSMKNEVLTNFEAEYSVAGPVPVLTGSCYTGNINTGFYVGAETLFFGLGALKHEGAVWVQVKELFKEGDACK